jgi:23S rRNA pseudouridine1911/1915/1917 synthase
MSRLVYLDSDVLVVDKASGEAVQGRRPEQKALLAEWRAAVGSPRMQPVHRIDQPVSGLLLLARSTEVFTTLQHALQNGDVAREYIAVVSTPPDPAAGTLEDRIAVAVRGNRSRIDPAGKLSVLEYETIGSTEHHTVVRIRLRTGRHHQIRVQLAHRGWHVVGDAKYGARRPLKGGGIALLAATLAFPHPTHPVTIACRASFPAGRMWEAVAAVVYAGESGETGGLPEADSPTSRDHSLGGGR